MVRRLDVSTSTVSTLAGNVFPGSMNDVGTIASFNLPVGIAVNAAQSVLLVVSALAKGLYLYVGGCGEEGE